MSLYGCWLTLWACLCIVAGIAPRLFSGSGLWLPKVRHQ